MATVALVAVLAVALASLTFAPQHWGVIEDVREPALQAAHEAGVEKAVWQTDLDYEMDYVADCSLDELEHEFAANGLTRNPVAMLLIVGDEPTDGSWAYREHPFSTHQTHVTVLDRGDRVYIEVHREWNHQRHPFLHKDDPGGPDTDPTGPERFGEVIETDHHDRYGTPTARVNDGVRGLLADDTDCEIEPYDP